ncbi:hypothetical protein ACFL59_15255 [Planctomycetota bacterium]
MDEMDIASLEAAFEAPVTQPTFEKLKERYLSAFEHTRDVHSAMAAVNEVSPEPITFEAFMDRFLRAA